MAIYNIHGGHSLKCRGAAGYLDEVDEDRKVKNKVIELLRKEGHTVYDCTDDIGTTASDNLKRIVNKCNAHSGVAIDVSIHLNAGGGTGPEVWIYSNKLYDVAERISSRIALAFGLRDRGVKYSTGLYVLKHTTAPALLVECCFVDSAQDKKVWDADKCAKAIVEGILNKTIATETVKKPTESKTTPFLVRVDTKKLPVRKGPGTNYGKTGLYTGVGTFTIVEVKEGKGSASGWGKLKSDAGWIALDATKRV